MLKRYFRKKNIPVFLAMWLATSISWSLNSYNLSNGASNQLVIEHDVCRKLSNSSGKAIFVPTRSSGEWNSFTNNATITGLTKVVCDHIPNAISLYSMEYDGYLEQTNTVTFSGIDVPIMITVDGYEDTSFGYGDIQSICCQLGDFTYSLNGGPDIPIDIIDDDGFFRSYYHEISINSGDTLSFKYYVSDAAGNRLRMNLSRATGDVVAITSDVYLTTENP